MIIVESQDDLQVKISDKQTHSNYDSLKADVN